MLNSTPFVPKTTHTRLVAKTVPGKRVAILSASGNESNAPSDVTESRSSRAPGCASKASTDMSQQDSSSTEAALRAQIIAALKTIYDPELPVNIYELGLIYGIDILPLGRVVVKMTLTSPACPVAGSLPGEVEVLVRAVRGVNEAEVQLVWDPPWTPDLLSDDTKLELNLL